MFVLGWLPAAFSSDLTPEQRAIAYLAVEVPRWSTENGCYSCHNNGDAARALYSARRLGIAVPPAALADTTAWLVRPNEWDRNRRDPAASDPKLARIQFSAALAEAQQAGVVRDPAPLAHAADSLLPLQHANGSWPVDTEVAVGSPATYGTALATHLARLTLQRADPRRYREAMARAERWLLAAPARSMPDAAAVLLALADVPGAEADRQRRLSLDRITAARSGDGGWGPFAHTPPEAFDTAVVLLALARSRAPSLLIQGGRAWLTKAQLPSGGWPATTRPSGSQSYAQHMSTTGWATLALLETSSGMLFNNRDRARRERADRLQLQPVAHLGF